MNPPLRCFQRAHPRWQHSNVWQVLMLFVVVVGVQTWRTWDVPTGVAPDFTAPARISSTDLSSPPESLNFAQWRTLHKGQAVALHFWAQWCPVCKYTSTTGYTTVWGLRIRLWWASLISNKNSV